MLVNRTKLAAPTSDPGEPPSSAANGARAGRAVATVCVRVGLAVLQFLSLLALARVVSPGTFGTVTFLLLSARLVAVIGAGGRGPQIVRQFAAKVRPGHDRLRSEIVRSARAALLPAVIVAALAWVLFAGDEPIERAAFLSFAFFVGAMGFSSAYPALEALKGMGRARLSFTLEILPTVVSVMVAWAVVRSLSAQLPVAVGLVALGLVTPVVIVWLWLKTEASPESVSEAGEGSPLNGSLFASTIISLAVPVSVQALAALFGGPADAGEIGAALRLMSPAMIVIAGLTGHELASVSRNVLDNNAAGVERAIRMTRIVAGALVVPYCVVFLAFPSLATTILGPAYSDIGTVVRLVAIAQIVNAVTGIVVETTQLLPGGARSDVRVVSGVFLVSLVVAAGLWGIVGRPAAESAAVIFACVISVRSVSASRQVRHQIRTFPKERSLASN